MMTPAALSPDALADAPTSAATMRPTRPYFWSVRREIWENRSVLLAPLVVAAVVLFASFLATLRFPGMLNVASALDAETRHAAIVKPFRLAPAPIMATTLLVGFLYCLDALYGERRDRSVLFWKSLPVSDRTTVLAKASIPLLVLPSIAYVLSVATFASLLVLSTAVLLASGTSPAPLWAAVRVFQEPVVMLYGLAVHALWFAPIYGWLLLVSAWARRAPLLWASTPFFFVSVAEKLFLDTSMTVSWLKYRAVGAMGRAFAKPVPEADAGPFLDLLARLTPGRFLATPDLWAGLAFAAVCLAAAARLRRNREPI